MKIKENQSSTVVRAQPVRIKADQIKANSGQFSEYASAVSFRPKSKLLTKAQAYHPLFVWWAVHL